MNILTKEKIVTALKSDFCKIVFTKVNGDERLLVGTLRADILPETVDNGDSTKTKKPYNPNVVSLWEMETSAWRSFRVDSVIEFEVIK